MSHPQRDRKPTNIMNIDDDPKAKKPSQGKSRSKASGSKRELSSPKEAEAPKPPLGAQEQAKRIKVHTPKVTNLAAQKPASPPEISSSPEASKKRSTSPQAKRTDLAPNASLDIEKRMDKLETTLSAILARLTPSTPEVAPPITPKQMHDPSPSPTAANVTPEATKNSSDQYPILNEDVRRKIKALEATQKTIGDTLVSLRQNGGTPDALMLGTTVHHEPVGATIEAVQPPKSTPRPTQGQRTPSQTIPHKRIHLADVTCNADYMHLELDEVRVVERMDPTHRKVGKGPRQVVKLFVTARLRMDTNGEPRGECNTAEIGIWGALGDVPPSFPQVGDVVRIRGITDLTPTGVFDKWHSVQIVSNWTDIKFQAVEDNGEIPWEKLLNPNRTMGRSKSSVSGQPQQPTPSPSKFCQDCGGALQGPNIRTHCYNGMPHMFQ